MGKRRRGLKFWGRKSKFFKMRLGKNIKLQGTLYTPVKKEKKRGEGREIKVRVKQKRIY